MHAPSVVTKICCAIFEKQCIPSASWSTHMKPEELNDFLKKRGTPCVQKAVQHGVQFRCETGEVLTVYKTGKVVIGGKRTPLCEELENLTAGAQSVAEVLGNMASEDAIAAVRRKVETLTERFPLYAWRRPAVFARA